MSNDRDTDKLSRRAFLVLLGACGAGIVALDPAGWIDWLDLKINGEDLSFERDDSLDSLDTQGIAWKRQGDWIQLQLTGNSIPGREIESAHLYSYIGGRRGSAHTDIVVHVKTGETSLDGMMQPDMSQSQWRITGKHIKLTDNMEVRIGENTKITAEKVS